MPESASTASATSCSDSRVNAPPMGPRSTETTQSPHANPATEQVPQSMIMSQTLDTWSDSHGPPSPGASVVGPPNSGRDTISIRSVAEHHRQRTNSISSANTVVSSVFGSPEMLTCQNSLTLIDRTMSNLVRLPQWAQRNRDCEFGIVSTCRTLPPIVGHLP